MDLDSDIVLSAEVHHANRSDHETLKESVALVQANLILTGSDVAVEELAADKGYHKAESLAWATAWRMRTYIAERKEKQPRSWTDNRTLTLKSFPDSPPNPGTSSTAC